MAEYNWAFGLGVVLNVGYVVVEAGFGFLAGSLALLADASHNAGDVLGLLLAWGAVSRFADPGPVAGATVIWVAVVGMVINLATALLFMAGRERDLNVRGAFIHMAADATVSAGVVVAGLSIRATGWLWLDPVVSLVIAGVIFWGTWGLLRDAFHLAMGGVPRDIDVAAVRAYLASLPGIEGVHDLHVWGLSTAEVALTAHLVKPDPRDDDFLVEQATRELRTRFDIDHVTLQWERGGLAECRDRSCDRATSSVSGETDYVVAGPGAGSKLEEARERDVPVMDEKEFVAFVRDRR